tara:strand:+ start:113 stop:361 length:249 start_codon:yes stop_codon:yes gene_type:complete
MSANAGQEKKEKLMKIIRNAGRDSQVWELQEDNGELVGTFGSRDEAEKAMDEGMPAAEVEVVEEAVAEAAMPSDKDLFAADA